MEENNQKDGPVRACSNYLHICMINGYVAKDFARKFCKTMCRLWKILQESCNRLLFTGQGGQAMVNLPQWLAERSGSHRQLHGGRGSKYQSLACQTPYFSRLSCQNIQFWYSMPSLICYFLIRPNNQA